MCASFALCVLGARAHAHHESRLGRMDLGQGSAALLPLSGQRARKTQQATIRGANLYDIVDEGLGQ